MSIQVVLFKLSVSLLIFLFSYISITESEVLKSLIIIVIVHEAWLRTLYCKCCVIVESSKIRIISHTYFDSSA